MGGYFQTNRRFADLLTRKKVPHEFRQLPGGHTWSYWDQQVKEVLRVASRKMNWRALESASLRSLAPAFQRRKDFCCSTLPFRQPATLVGFSLMD